MHLEAVPQAHAAAFIGRQPWDVARNAELLADAHLNAWRCYSQRMVVPVIEPHFAEAEAWGATVAAGENGRYFIHATPVLERFEALLDLPPIDPARPSLEVTLAATRLLAREIRSTLAVPVTGPLAVAVGLLGREPFLAQLARDPQRVRATLLEIVEKMQPWIDAIGRESHAIAIFEAGYTPEMLAPEVYASTILPALTELVARARRATREAPALLVAGNTAPIAGHLCATQAGYVVCPETTSRTAFLAQARCFPETTVRVDLGRALWTGNDWPAICRAIADAAGTARLHARTVLGTGPLPLTASSVLVVDACHFGTNMDPWLDPL